jgi:4-amino-4-deoxy-L-arabinose transferase-like glycosyltransferase
LNNHRLQYLILLLILLLAFALRAYRIDASALRGDEAFAVRYWAAPPSEVLQHLAWVEPHPFGTFFGFWAWKSLVGESELAMRMLPALLNLLGVAAMYALARRLRMGTWAALLAAFLWAVNPGLIWHSQDVRNYAPWAGLSAVALWLLVRAVDKRRRIDWVLYVIVEVITLYVFFLEAFMLVVHWLYLLWVAWRGGGKRQGEEARRWDRRLLQSFLVSVVAIGVLLIPWLYQAYRLAGSGYGGTAERANLLELIGFVTEWLVAVPVTQANLDVELGFTFVAIFAVLFLFLAVTLSRLTEKPNDSRLNALAMLMVVLLPLLLSVVSLRLDVFRARYVLAIMPALFLLIISTFVYGAHNRWAGQFALFAGSSLLVGLVAINLSFLSRYYVGDIPKAPDWRELRDTLKAEIGAEDVLALVGADDRGTIDPAFEFYYTGDYEVLPLSGADGVDNEVLRLLSEHQTVFLVDQGNSFVGGRFRANAVYLGEQWQGGLRLSRFRSIEIQEGEIQQPLDLAMLGGQVQGWSIEGDPNRRDPLFFLLYWSAPIVQRDAPWKVFVHLLDARGQTAGQGDLPTSGSAGRETYPLERINFSPGTYTLRFGLYREDTGERAIITDATTGEVLGDYLDLGTITVEPGS